MCSSKIFCRDPAQRSLLFANLNRMLGRQNFKIFAGLWLTLTDKN